MTDQDGTANDAEKQYRSREFVRGAVKIDAEIREQWAGKQRIAVIDLSRSGFRMQCDSLIPEDRTVFLTMPGFAPMEATIAWHESNLYRCKFTNRLHEAVYDHVVRKFPQLG